MTDPRWLTAAKNDVGIREVPGRVHNKTILGWAKALKSWVTDDETPWCGLFVASIMQRSGLTYPTEYLRARAWADWGSNLRSDRVSPGAILVFARKGGGHVGFYLGEDPESYHVLGGNQDNSVSVMRISKARCIAIRWPKGEPVEGRPVLLAANAPLSINEA